MFGIWHIGAHPDHCPLKQGFDEFFGNRSGFIDNYHHFGGHGIGSHDLFEGTNEVFQRDVYYPNLIADRAVSFTERHQDKPFFLFFSFNFPHSEQPVGPCANGYDNLREPRRSYALEISTCDHVEAKPEIVKRLSALHKAWAKDVLSIFEQYEP